MWVNAYALLLFSSESGLSQLIVQVWNSKAKPSSAIFPSIRLCHTCYLLCLGDKIMYNDIGTAIEEILTMQTAEEKNEETKKKKKEK